jgi:hypothetical protein
VTITLPRLPRGAGYSVRFVRASETQRSGMGSLTPLNRAGDHFAVEVDPGVLAVSCGRELLADLARGHGERLRAPLPEPGVDKGSVGTPLVAGADQAGTSLDLDGFTPQCVIRKGWFFTLETADGSSAHIVAEEVIANAAGAVTVSFWPELWLEPGDNDPIVLIDPYIEGLIVDEGDQASGRFAAVSTAPFVIEEG